MKINAQPRAARLSKALLVTPLVIAALGVAPCLAQARLYTNADLKALDSSSEQGERRTLRNSDLKAPLPTQAAPLVESASWDAVIAFIERERAFEQKRKETDLEYAKLALANEQLQHQAYDRYAYGRASYYPGFPFFSVGRFAPFTTPSNPYVSLHQRGISSAQELFRESVRDSVIRRSNLP